MSSFIRLEGTYLKILRYSILVLATLVLLLTITSAVIGLSNVGAFNFSLKKEVPEVKSEFVLDRMNALTNNATSTGNTAPTSTSKTTSQADPNQPYYDRCAKAAENFVTAYSSITVNQDASEWFKTKARNYNDEETIKSFASGLADTLEKVLAEKTVIKRAANESAVDVVNQVINTYVNKFDEELSRINEEKAASELKTSMKRASGVMLLSVAGGSFLAFLLLAFLMIFVKIELNLRDIASKA
ncbi:MAG TPA: hypothetical protein VN371_09635 [Chlorobaculum sp.]|nr:hypothetical protein [Chlorobaculum sp.]